MKHYRLADLAARLRQLIRPAKAVREFQHALALSDRAVPTVLPLAMGERIGNRGRRESFFITRGLEEVQPLGRFLETDLPLLSEEEQTRSRHQLAAALGVFVARLHEAGIAHHDLHVANIMIRHEESGPALFLLDLDAVRLSAPLSWRASRDNLVLLNRYFSLHETVPTACASGMPIAERVLPAAALGASSASVAILVRPLIWPPRLKKRPGSRTWNSGGVAIAAVVEPIVTTSASTMAPTQGMPLPTLAAVSWTVCSADALTLFTQPGVVLYKNSLSSQVAHFEMAIAGQKRQVVLKRFSPQVA